MPDLPGKELQVLDDDGDNDDEDRNAMHFNTACLSSCHLTARVLVWDCLVKS